MADSKNLVFFLYKISYKEESTDLAGVFDIQREDGAPTPAYWVGDPQSSGIPPFQEIGEQSS